MCGIAGYWNFRSGRPAEAGLVRRMTETLVHRGPDEGGVWCDGDVALGARRLSIIDLEGGSQPMANESGSVRVVVNGEIYNHDGLRRELEGRGHRFRSRCDTEVVAHAFEEWGAGCVDRLDGMFALAAWSADRQALLLARDRVGIKPLYVHEGPEGVAFGSELAPLMTLPWIPPEWDPEAVDDFLTYEYVPAPASIVRDVRKLRPGTLRLYRRDRTDGPVRRRYWRPRPASSPPASPEEAASGLRERLRTSVERRLMADVPLGAFLSGGVDSSIVVALMRGAVPGELRTFSLGFDDPTYDELEYARLVASRFGTTHREERVTPEVVELADALAGYLDEPFADVSSFPTYLVSRLARDDVKVVLSGDGGDELFAGYDQYRAHRWARRLRWLTERSGWSVVDRLLHAVPPSSKKKGLVNRGRRFARGLRLPADLEHARWWVFQDLAERRALYGPEMERRLGDRDPFGHYRRRLDEAADAGFRGLQRQLYADVTGYLPDDILTKVDRMSMAASLEARVPFLDHRVVEYAMAIPADWKLRRGRTKWILKEAFRRELPREILERGKEGFSIPMKNWLRGPLRPMMHDLLSPERLERRGWFDAGEVRRLVREHEAGRDNHAHRLWCLMSLELSLRSLSETAAGSGRPAAGSPGPGP